LEWRQLEEREQLSDDGMEGEMKARHDHSPVKADIPRPRLREDGPIRSRKMKLHESQDIKVMVEEGFVHRRIYEMKLEGVVHVWWDISDKRNLARRGGFAAPSNRPRLFDTEKRKVRDGVSFLKESLQRAVNGRHFFVLTKEGWGAELKERRAKCIEAKAQINEKISKQKWGVFILETPDAWHDHNGCH
jgi:hypothetical protein